MQRFGFQPRPATAAAAPTNPPATDDDTFLDAGLQAVVKDVIAAFVDRGMGQPTREEIHAIALASMLASKAALTSAIETAIRLRSAK